MCPTPNHMTILKVLRVSLNLIEYSNTIDTNLFIHRSSVHRGVKHIGMQKVNYANTQMKPINLNFLDSLYPRRKVIAITESSKTMQTACSTKIWTNFPSVKVWRRRVTRQIFNIDCTSKRPFRVHAFEIWNWSSSLPAYSIQYTLSKSKRGTLQYTSKGRNLAQ